METVFPAYAGMFLSMNWVTCLNQGFPRIRGDVPLDAAYTVIVKQFSPHTRGCSDLKLPILGVDSVFPAYAGMFRKRFHKAWGAG